MKAHLSNGPVQNLGAIFQSVRAQLAGFRGRLRRYPEMFSSLPNRRALSLGRNGLI